MLTLIHRCKKLTMKNRCLNDVFPAFLRLKSRQVVLTVASVLLLQACSEVTAEEGEKKHYLQANSDYLLQQDSYQVENKFVGKVIAKQDADLGFELAGIVNTLYVIEGQSVTKGQVLAELDTQLLKIERAQLQAQLAQAQAEFNLVDANLKRVSSLISRGFTSEQNIDELSSQKLVISANMRSTKAALEGSRYRINKSKLVAPFDGIISSRSIAQGEVIAAGTPAFRLLQSGQLEITIGVPATFVRQMSENKQGKQHDVEIAGETYSATLLTTGNEVNSVTRTISLRFSLPEDSPVFNGQLAYLKLPQMYQETGYWVPLTAITDGVRGMWNIYTLEQTSPELYELSNATVTVLHATETAAYVQGNLQNNQSFVTSGIHRFVPGQLVKVADSNVLPTSIK